MGTVKKRSKVKSLSVEPQDKPDVAELINKVQQQLSAIEKKLDILISQPPKRPFEESYSQKPFRHFDRSRRHDRGRQGHGPGERTYTKVICADCNKECEIPFKPSGDRPVYCRECFPRHKKGDSFNSNRDNRSEGGFNRGRRFDKRPPEESRKPFRKRRSFLAGGERNI